MKINVEYFRSIGYQVRVTHYRSYYNYDYLPEVRVDVLPNHEADITYALPRGGKTVVELTAPDGTTVVGESHCSKKDAYCKKTGVQVALNRAVAKFLQMATVK